MKLLIAIPCMDMVHTPFFKSVISMRCPADIQAEFTISSGSLVYDSRNLLAKKAIEHGFDRVLWLDSDMEFQSDLLLRMNEDIDSGLDYVSGLYFKRKPPINPVVYKAVGLTPEADGKSFTPYAHSFEEYPEDGLFEIKASGFGAVMTTVDLLRRVQKEFGLPFAPVNGFGEDLSFCLRVTELGVKMWCDSRIKLGHIGYYNYNEDVYRELKKDGN